MKEYDVIIIGEAVDGAGVWQAVGARAGQRLRPVLSADREARPRLPGGRGGTLSGWRTVAGAGLVAHALSWPARPARTTTDPLNLRRSA